MNTSTDIACAKPINHRPPWPTIIISILGAILIMYTAIGSGIPQDRRIFGVVMLILWTAIWAILLWVLWKDGHMNTAWWMSIIGVGILVLFFVVVVALNLGNP